MKVVAYYKAFINEEAYIAVSYSTFTELKAEPSECVFSGALVIIPVKYVAQHEVQHSGFVRFLD